MTRYCSNCRKKIEWKWEDFDWNDGIDHIDCVESDNCYCKLCMECAQKEMTENDL